MAEFTAEELSIIKTDYNRCPVCKNRISASQPETNGPNEVVIRYKCLNCGSRYAKVFSSYHTVLFHRGGPKLADKVAIPTGFACYSTKGDKVLQRKAQAFINRLDKIEKPTEGQVRSACKAFYKGCRDLGRKSNEEGYGDTEVRECVRDFAEKILEVYHMKDEEEKIWDNA